MDHGVISSRKYSLKNPAMPRPSGIMQSGVSINPNRNPQKGDTKTSSRSAKTVNTGWPSARTVGTQWPNKVRKCPPEKNGSSPQTTADQKPVGRTSKKQPGLCNHVVLSDGSRSLDKLALSECHRQVL